MQHDFYKNGDADIPSSITDQHDDVVLTMCKACGLAECELVSDNCEAKRPETVAALAKAPRKSHVRITTGQVAAVLGVSKTMKRSAVLREMVRRYHQAESEYTPNVATEYADQYREVANNAFCDKFKLNVHPADVKKPHKLISCNPGLIKSAKREGMGLLYLRLPYGQRDAVEAKNFNTIDDQPHHFAQMQIEMHYAGVTWGVFHQWSVMSSRSDVIEIDTKWLEVNLPQIDAFYAEYKEACKDSKLHLEPLRKSVDNELARKLINEHDELKTSITNAQARQGEILDKLKEMAGDQSAIVCGRLLTKTVAEQGNVSYAAAVKELLPGVDLSKYRGAPSTKWTFT